MAFEKLHKLNRRVNKVLGIEKPRAKLPEWMQRLIDGDIPDWYKAQVLEETTGQIGQVLDAIQRSPKRVVQMPQVSAGMCAINPYAIGVDPAIPSSSGTVVIRTDNGERLRVRMVLYWETTDGSRIGTGEDDERLPS